MTKIERVANAQCRYYVNNRSAFKGSNLHGEVRANLYIVWSYKWYPLYIYDFKLQCWYANNERYSVSTSRQASQSHPEASGIHYISHESMKDVLAGKDCRLAQWKPELIA